jgi:2,4-dienoyl-CoA reductase-like NADH-dependent reductase (Old Yellow Enzyme family)
MTRSLTKPRHANERADEYGGSIENRCRFPLEVLDAIIDVWGSRQVGIKICPADDYNDSTTTYKEASETYGYYIRQLMRRELCYINLSRRGCDVGRDQDEYFKSKPRPEGKELPTKYEPIQEFGHLIKYPGSRTMLMVNHEYTVSEAEDLMQQGQIDLVSFGRPFIYNPVSFDCRNHEGRASSDALQDIITRIEHSVPFAVNDKGGKVNYGPFRTPDEYYTDWPTALVG